MKFNINNLLDKILFEFKTLNPKYSRQLDDPRIDTYYISINKNNFIVLCGICDECDHISICNNNNINHNIMTTHGLDMFVNQENQENIDDTNNVIFEIELDTFNGNIDNLILLVKNSIQKIIN